MCSDDMAKPVVGLRALQVSEVRRYIIIYVGVSRLLFIMLSFLMLHLRILPEFEMFFFFRKRILVVPPLKLVCRVASLVNTHICRFKLHSQLHNVSFVIALEQKQSGHAWYLFLLIDFYFYLCHLVTSLRLTFWPSHFFQMNRWHVTIQLYWPRAWPQNRRDVAVWANVHNVLKLLSGEPKTVSIEEWDVAGWLQQKCHWRTVMKCFFFNSEP